MTLLRTTSKRATRKMGMAKRNLIQSVETDLSHRVLTIVFRPRDRRSSSLFAHLLRLQNEKCLAVQSICTKYQTTQNERKLAHHCKQVQIESHQEEAVM